MRKTNKNLIAVSMIIATVLVIFINIFLSVTANYIDVRFDLTRNNVFEIDNNTKSVLRDFEQPVNILVLAKEETFVSNSIYNAHANQVFRQFSLYGRTINLVYIDFVSDPSIATKYPNLQIKLGDILIESEMDVHHIPTKDLFNYTYDQRGQLVISSSKAEEVLLTGLQAVVSEIKPKIGIIKGHAEYDMPEFIALLERNNYEVTTINLVTEDISSEINAIALFAPKNDLTLEELVKIDLFLENNGDYNRLLFYTADPGQQALPNISVFLREWGIEVTSGSVFETNENRVYNYQPFYGIVDYVNYQFEDMLMTNTIPMLMPLSRPINVLFEHRNNYSTSILTQFGQSSGVRPEDAPQDFTASMATQRGPIPALVLATRRFNNTANSPSSRILVSGSTAFMDVFALTNSSFSNSEYILNVINTYSNNSESIRVLPKQIIGSSLNLTKFQADMIGSFFVFGSLIIMLVMAVFVYIKRKNL